MNLLLLHPAEVKNGRATLGGRRAQHCLTVLKTEVGATLRAGIENRGRCVATVERVQEGSIVVSLSELSPCSAPRIHVALAVPRPKGLSRIVSAVSSFGVQSLTLFNAWRVERSYFSSARLSPERLHSDLVLGAEQGEQVWLPRYQVIDSFRQFVEDVVPKQFDNTTRVVCDPSGRQSLRQLLPSEARAEHREVLICFGPDGGFIQAELDSFQTAQFQVTTLTTGPLRTEVAVAAGLGQLALLVSGRSEAP